MPKNLKHLMTDAATTKKSKPRKEQSRMPKPRKSTVFDGLSADIPGNLIIKSIVDNKGRQTGHLLVKATDQQDMPIYGILSVKELALGRCDELAHLLVKAKLAGQLSPKRLRALAAAFTEHNGKDVHVVQRDGFHSIEIQGKRYGFYVIGERIYKFGQNAPLEVVVNNESRAAESTGDLDSWQATVGVYLAGNPYMLVSVLAALAPALVRPFGLSVPILAIVAPSSLGKTTLQQVGRSIRERADKIEDASGTTNGLRAKLEQYPDAPAFLQDVHKVEDLAGLMGLLFLVANGGHRVTSTSGQKMLAGAELACGLSLSMEMTFLEMVGATKISLPEGFSARCFEMVLQGPHGAFHKLPDGVTPHDFANQLKRACSDNYGVPWAEWIPAIAKNADKLRDWLPKNLHKAESALLEGRHVKDRVTLRLISGLATWLVVGWLAINLKVLKIKQEVVTKAVRMVLSEYLRRQANQSTPIGEKVISTVRDLIDRNSSRFPALSMFGRSDQSNVLGYTKGHGRELVYLFLPGVLEDLLAGKFGLHMAFQKLGEAGYLLKNSEGWQMQIRVGEMRKRFYAIHSSIRFDGDYEVNEDKVEAED
jgi:Domain of unknown function (DUF927)